MIRGQFSSGTLTCTSGMSHKYRTICIGPGTDMDSGFPPSPGRTANEKLCGFTLIYDAMVDT